MNSRYKFRVWSCVSKDYCDEEIFLLPDGRVGFFVKSMGYPHYRLFGRQENMTVERNTGVKDHSGKFIFEGDVVRMYIPCEDKHRICVVEYQIDEDDTAQWLCRYLDGKRKHNTFGSTIEITAEYLSGSYCEIIGNIHEYSADA